MTASGWTKSGNMKRKYWQEDKLLGIIPPCLMSKISKELGTHEK